MRGLTRFLPTRASRFVRDQDGAVTVDFVMLAAACIGLAFAISSLMGGITMDHSNRMADKFSEVGIRTY